MRLNLSDQPLTAELLVQALARSGTAVMAVNGTSMHPTIQMGWRVFVKPARGEDLRVGDIAVFRGEAYLTVHRLVWKERAAGEETLVFRGDYNRLRERVPARAVVGRVTAVEVPGRRKGQEKVIAIEADVLALFYRAAWTASALVPALRRTPAAHSSPGPLGRLARTAFAGAERALSLFLPSRR